MLRMNIDDPNCGEKVLVLVLESTVYGEIQAQTPISHWDSGHLLSMATCSRATLTAYETKLAPLIPSYANLSYELCPSYYTFNEPCHQCLLYGGLSCCTVNVIRLLTTHQNGINVDANNRHFIASSLWNPYLLARLCQSTDKALADGTSRRMVALERILRTIIGDDAQRSHALLDIIMQLHASLGPPMANVLDRGVASLYEAIVVGQTYLETVWRCETNMGSLLRRLALKNNDRVTEKLVAPSTDIIILFNRLTEYCYERFVYDEENLCQFIAHDESDQQREMFSHLLSYMDMPQRRNGLASTLCVKLYTLLLPCHRNGERIHSGTLNRALQWLSRRLPSHVTTVEHRASVMRAILRHMNICVNDYGGNHDYFKRLVSVTHLLRPSEIHLVEKELDQYIEAMRKAKKLGTNDREILIDIMSRINEQSTSDQITNQSSKTTYPTKSPLDMTLEELCDNAKNFPNHVASHALEYETAFNMQLDRCFDTGAMPHATLIAANHILRFYAKIRTERPLDLRHEHVVMYRMCMTAFLSDIVLSVPGLRERCPCCDQAYSDCVMPFIDINQLILLDHECDQLLQQVITLSQLPQLERALGFEDGDMQCDEVLIHDKDDAFLDYSGVEEVDDGIELGHFDSGDEESV